MSKNDTKPYNTRSAATTKKGKTNKIVDNKSNNKTKATKENYTVHMSSDEEEDDDDYEDVSSEDDDITDSEDVSEFIDTEDEEEVNKLEVKEFQKFLYELYPSKFMKDKVDGQEEKKKKKEKEKE